MRNFWNGFLFLAASLSASLAASLAAPWPAQAASFDCGKARAPLEKAICADPRLSRADEALARAYKAAQSAFPVPQFVRDSQRVWLRAAPICVKDAPGACLALFEARIAALENYPKARVYADYGKAYSHESATLLVYERDGATWLEWFGHWMPDAYRPKPFPDGYIAHDWEKLVVRGAGFFLEQADASLSLDDEKIVIEAPGIMLSARQGPIHGAYARVR
jgi:uncharacterized protein